MAIVTIDSVPTGGLSFAANFFSGTFSVSQKTDSGFNVSFQDGTSFEFDGTDLTYGLGGLPIGGFITGMRWFESNVQVMTVTDMGMDSGTFTQLFGSEDAAGFF